METALRATQIIAYLQSQITVENPDPLVLVTRPISLPIDAPIVGFSSSIVGQHPPSVEPNFWPEDELQEKFPGTPVEQAIVLEII